MAAANPKGRAIAGSIGKRFINQIWAAQPPYAVASPAPLTSSVRTVHVSSYDKNVDEQVRPIVVPDHVIDATSDKYWGPHPTTGVFGPAGGDNIVDGGKPVPTAGGDPSALDQTVWFRPHEVDKAPPA